MDSNRSGASHNPYHNGIPSQAPYPESSEPTPERQRGGHSYTRTETPPVGSYMHNPFAGAYLRSPSCPDSPDPYTSPPPFVTEHLTREPAYPEPPQDSRIPTGTNPSAYPATHEDPRIPMRVQGGARASPGRATPQGPRPLAASPLPYSNDRLYSSPPPVPSYDNLPSARIPEPSYTSPYPEETGLPYIGNTAYQPHGNGLSPGYDTGIGRNSYGGGPDYYDDVDHADLLRTRSGYLQRGQSQLKRHTAQLGYSLGGVGAHYESDDADEFPEDNENFMPFPGDSYALNTYNYPSSYESSLASEHTTGYDEDTDITDDRSVTDVSEHSFAEDVPAPPETQLRREVPILVHLFRGNFVLDFPVAPMLLKQYPDRAEREFTFMRYTAVTCGPEDFVRNNFVLRQTCYMEPRQTEIFICITLYNEDDVTLARSLQGIFENIRNLVRRKNSQVWNSDAWKKIVVCVVSDGRKHINPRAEALLAALGAYQPGFGMSKVNADPVVAHLYESSTMLDVWVQGGAVKMERSKSCPIQMLFCLKEENKQKINSHRWFFQAFGPILAPKICILVDAGTQPSGKSLYHLWKTFDVHGNVGGACGEIKAALGQGWHKLYNPLVACQNFEYKMSNILDKPLESVFGYISVLPGAFSAYRYTAIQDGPLEKYYLGETKGHGNTSSKNTGAGVPLLSTYDGNGSSSSSDMQMEEPMEDVTLANEEKAAKAGKKKQKRFGIFDANMYLAEDRILCFELVMQSRQRWLSKYVKSARAETDVPETLAELVLQRRRWLNGSFFAAIYAQAHFYSIWTSGHSIGRKIVLQIEFIYQLVTVLVSWFSVGNFFLVFRILTNSLGDSTLGFAPGKVLSTVFLWIYAGSLCTMFVLSFGNRPKGTQGLYITITTFFAILMVYLMFAAIYISVKSVQYALCNNNNHFSIRLVFTNETFRDLVISTLSTYALYFVVSFLSFEPWHMFTSFLQYLLMSPSYINVFNVYAFCNIHDISWGTKSATKVELLTEAKTTDTDPNFFGLSGNVTDLLGENKYLKQLDILKTPPSKDKTPPSVEDVTKDFYAMFRSMVVLSWMFSNIALVAVVLNTAGFDVFEKSSTSSTSPNGASNTKRAVDFAGSVATRAFVTGDGNATLLGRMVGGAMQLFERADCQAIGGGESTQTKIYLSVILWMVAALAAFRFVGAILYLTLRILGR